MNLFMLRNFKKINIIFFTFFLVLITLSILIAPRLTNALVCSPSDPNCSANPEAGYGESNTNFGPGGGRVNNVGPVKISNPLGVNTFVEAISKILDYLIYISIPILALMILWGGFQILTAREAPEKIKNGKTTIMWAVVGFIIVLASKGMALIFIEVFSN